MAAANVAYFWASRPSLMLYGMSSNPPNPQPEKTLRRLYPHLGESQAREADENLKRYVAFALGVFERLELDMDAWARFEALTASRRASSMNDKRPGTNSTNGT